MDATTTAGQRLATLAGRVAQRLLLIGGNRVELLMIEMQEERERLLHAVIMAFAMAVLALLAGMTLTAAVILALWASSPVLVLLALTAIYGAAGLVLYRRFASGLLGWRAFSASLEQLRKDRVCAEEMLA